MADVHLGDGVRLRPTIVQQKTDRPIPFELAETTRETLAAWLKRRGLRTGDWLFPRRNRPGEHLTTRQYGRLVDEWVALSGLDPAGYGTHSLRRTKVALIYRLTGNLRACQLLLGHTKLESTVRYLSIKADDALVMSEQTDICPLPRRPRRSPHPGAHHPRRMIKERGSSSRSEFFPAPLPVRT